MNIIALDFVLINTKSKDGKWRICRAKMIAPLFFWREIQYRI
jgi:hypothetical protein